MIQYKTITDALNTFGKIEDEAALLRFATTLAAAEGETVSATVNLLHAYANQWVHTYTGGMAFVVNLRKSVVGNSKTLTERQLKGVLNCLRVDPEGKGMKGRSGNAPSQPAGARGPATYSVKTSMAFDITKSKDGVSLKKNGTVHCVVTSLSGKAYLFTRSAKGKWADFTFISGGVTKDEIDGANPYHLPKVGMQKPGGEVLLAAGVEEGDIKRLLVNHFGATHIANAKGHTPEPTPVVDPEPVAEEPAPVVEVDGVTFPTKKPKSTAPKRKEPVAAEPAAPAKAAGTSIRDLVRQRNGM